MATTDAAARGTDKDWWPPGFRFHPTDEELVLYYLKRKISGRRFRLPMIADVDVYKLDPWDLPDKSLLRSGDKQWYFFSPRDKKYPNGSRSNRATNNGYWKATGKDRAISHYSKVVGNKKTLVYYHGRAPKGNRTDWVMHEYTVDEGELLSYKNVQDYYALYKVFRKSGPGPKNGEQYGAPFREEEWDIDDDDDHSADDSLKNKNNGDVPILEQPKVDSVPSMFNDNQNTFPIDDLEGLLLQISDEPDLVQQHSEASAFRSEVDFEAEVGSCTLTHLETTASELNDSWSELCNMAMGFEIPSLASTDPLDFERSQVTSATNFVEQNQLTPTEEFLEIEDLFNPETEVLSTSDTCNENKVQYTNGLEDLDEYFDASMFVGEAMEPIDGATSSLYFGGFNDDESQDQLCHLTTDLWVHEQALNLSTAEPNVVTMVSPPSGVVYTNNVANVSEPTLAQGTLVRSASDSWFNSALSTLLDSVPTRPALASENALINRALERMSSFGARQRGARNQDNTAGGASSIRRRRGNDGANYLFLSLLVGLGAVIWVLSIGTAVKVIKAVWSKFIS